MNFGIPYFPPIGATALAVICVLGFVALTGLVIYGVCSVFSAYEMHMDDGDDY